MTEDIDTPYTDEEWQERLRNAVDATLNKRRVRTQQREQFEQARAHGLKRRHAQRTDVQDDSQ